MRSTGTCGPGRVGSAGKPGRRRPRRLTGRRRSPRRRRPGTSSSGRARRQSARRARSRRSARRGSRCRARPFRQRHRRRRGPRRSGRRRGSRVRGRRRTRARCGDLRRCPRPGRGAVGIQQQLRESGAGDLDEATPHLVGVRPVLRLGVEQVGEQRFERPRAHGWATAALDDGGEHGERVVPFVRGRALDGGVQRRGEAPEVARRPPGLTARAFRWQVGRGAQQDPRAGQARVADRARDAEVGEPRPAVLLDEDVARLDVPVLDAGAVHGGEGCEQVEPDPGRLLGRQQLLTDTCAERLCLHQLEDDPRAVGVLDHVEDGDEHRVAHRSRGAGLAQHPLAEDPTLLVVEGRRQVDLLDRDGPAEQDVLGAPHGPGAAAAEDGTQGVAVADTTTDSGVGFQRHPSSIPRRTRWSP